MNLINIVLTIAMIGSTLSSLGLEAESHRPLPPPGLKGKDMELRGKWVQLDSYCSDWSDEEKREFYLAKKEYRFMEHLFIDGWHFKFIQNQLSAEDSPNPPYDFCYQSSTHYSESFSGKIYLSKEESFKKKNCRTIVASPLSDKNSYVKYRWLSRTKFNQQILIQIRGKETCGGSDFWMARYKKID